MRLCILILALLISPAWAISTWDVKISLDADGNAHWQVTLNYTENITRSDYWIFSRISDVKVFVNGTEVSCKTETLELGTSIMCDRIPPTSSIMYTFTSFGQVSKFHAFDQFKYTFGVISPTTRFSVLLKLPLGTALVEKTKLVGMPVAPFEPGYGIEGSDGRQIFIKWELENPMVGDSIAVSVLFEQVGVVHGGISTEIIGMIVAAAAVIIFLLWWHFKRTAKQELLPLLTPPERAVMELLLENRVADQTELVKQTGFSKAKISRIVRSLASRRLVSTHEVGRTKEVRLMQARPGWRRAKLTRPSAALRNLIKPWITHLRTEIRASKSVFTPEATPFTELKVEPGIRDLYEELRYAYPSVEALFIAHNHAVERFYSELRHFSNQRTIRALADDVRNIAERMLTQLREIRERIEH